MTANLYQVSPESIRGLSPDEVRLFNELLEVWSRKYARNYVRKRYYDAKNALKDLGISIPPALRKVEVVSGWPAKAVDALAVRSIFDGFTFKGKAEDDLNDLLEQNSFKLRYSQATTSELINSCAFATVSKGADDEPQVLVSFHSALNAAAMWDYRKGRIKCGIVVTDYDESPTYGFIPNQVNMYTDDSVVVCSRSRNNRWTSERLPNEHGRPLMEPLVYRPSLDRPFGKSRISRAVMSITDSAKRTLLRTEVSSELFTSPQRYLLGADEDAFGDDGAEARAKKVQAYFGSIFAITPNENGDIPQYGQLSQMSMQPHTDYLRSLAAQLAGETGIPISSLGVIHDNPASAEAMYAASEDLIIEAEALNDTNARSLENVARLVLATMKGVPFGSLEEDDRRVVANFKNPMRPSIASQTDAIMKQLAVFPWMADSRITYQELGYTESQIDSLMETKRQYEARQTVLQVRSQTNARANTEADGGGVPNRAGEDEGRGEPGSERVPGEDSGGVQRAGEGAGRGDGDSER